MRGLFLALPAILLSPKRAMRQLCSQSAHIMTQPLGTGRHLLKQMDVYSLGRKKNRVQPRQAVGTRPKRLRIRA